MTPLPTGRFIPIGLPALLEEAELLTRFDRKYLLDRAQATALLQTLDPRTRVLTIDGRTRFRYESVYFDTPDLLSYRQAVQARRHRFKVRTRSYLDSGLAFLEVKVRGDREITVKDRLAHDLRARGELTESGRDYAEATLTARGLDGSVARQLSPALITRYRRITLVPPEPGLRVTVDAELSWVSPRRHGLPDGQASHYLPDNGSGRHIWRPGALYGRKWGKAGEPEELTDLEEPSLALPDLVIVETKAGARPSGVDRLLWRSGHRPVSISKYGTGLAALRDELPANKWARVLRHHFLLTEELARAA